MNYQFNENQNLTDDMYINDQEVQKTHLLNHRAYINCYAIIASLI